MLGASSCSGLGCRLIGVAVAALIVETGMEVGLGASSGDHGEDGLIGILGGFAICRGDIVLCIVSVLQSLWEVH